MLDNITEKLSEAMKALRGHSRLTEENIGQAMREVRMALLEADVAVPVVKAYVERLKAAALGQDVLGSLTPGQALVGIAQDELVELMGDASELDFSVQAPAVVLMCGLQGAGKTTTCGKLARMLKEGKKKVMLASVDTQRPAAVKQLEVLASSVGALFFAPEPGMGPVEIASAALAKAKVSYVDVLIVDTAGRLSIDEGLMGELARIEAAVNPAECLLAIDAMMGQQALDVAAAFAGRVKLTGIALTKLDGDSRGGAMLSARHVTGLPIKLAGVSERMDGLEAFDPRRMAGRILGMGDIMGLVEQARRHHDEKAGARLEAKFKSGARFDLEDFLGQIKQLRAMGGISSFMDKLPMEAQKLAAGAPRASGDKEMARMEGIISSMTPKERADPSLVKGSRKARVAKGAGVEVMHVNQLLKKHEMVSGMMRMMQKGGLGKIMRMGAKPKSGSKGSKGKKKR